MMFQDKQDELRRVLFILINHVNPVQLRLRTRTSTSL